MNMVHALRVTVRGLTIRCIRCATGMTLVDMMCGAVMCGREPGSEETLIILVTSDIRTADPRTHNTTATIG